MDGCSYGDVRQCFTEALVCGIIQADGHVQLNPPDEAVVHTQDRLLALADTADKFKPATLCQVIPGCAPGWWSVSQAKHIWMSGT